MDTSTFIFPAPEQGEPFNEPSHPDGRPYAFMMVRGEDVVMADTRTALVCSILEAPYYKAVEDEDHEEMLGLRYEAAVSLAHHVQSTVISVGQERGLFDADALSQTPEGNEKLQALMIGRTVPYESDGEVWDGPVPLILVRTDYAPFTDRPLPEGTEGMVMFVDPSNEETFLNSLAFYDQILLLHSEAAEEAADDLEDAILEAAATTGD